MPTEEWSICCNWDGDWVCCDGIVVSGGTYFKRLLAPQGWDESGIFPEWHDVYYKRPVCALPDEGCDWGDTEHNSCSPGWEKSVYANPCP